MKHAKTLAAIMLAMAMLLSMVGCSKTEEQDLWETAVYTKDTELGEGEKTLSIQVTAQDKTVTFTIHTDKTTVGDALIENELLEGEMGDFGIYINSVNGMIADYDENQSYWAFYIDGEYAMTGVDGTDITEGTEYKLEYTIME